MGDEDELLPEDNMNEETEREISHCKVLKTFSKVSEGKKKIVNWFTCSSLSRTIVSEKENSNNLDRTWR